MSTTLADLADLVNGRLNGEPTTLISGAATLEIVAAGQITLADNTDRTQQFNESTAAAAIVSKELAVNDKPTIVVDNVRESFAKVVSHFRPIRSRTRQGVSGQASVSSTAQLADGVEVHPFATIGDDVTIGSGSTIHSGVRILAGCIIGSDVKIFPNAVLYEETQVGDRSIIHAGVILGAYGFGYQENDGKHEISAQLGYVQLGNDVEIGANSTVDRGTYGPTSIGEGTKIDNLAQVAHNCRLGKHNLICAQVGIAGSATTGDYVVMAGQVGVCDHVHIGDKTVLCSKSGLTTSVSGEEVLLGQPAIPIHRHKLQLVAITKLPEMRKQFRAMQRQIKELEKKLSESANQNSGEQAA